MSASNPSITKSPSGSSGWGYSSIVKLSLRINGEKFRLARVGPDRLYFREVVSLPAGRAELSIKVDGEPQSSFILIPE